MRRTSEIVRPLRRAVEAVKLVRSSEGMPASTTRPPGRTASTAASTAAWTPAASIATSRPKPPAAVAMARASFPSAGKTRAPRARAASSRCGREARSVA